MAPRTYAQYCSLARALDLVGERWTLLLVRDLIGGPKRYGELLAGLPGIGTNLLAARLKELVRLGLVEREAAEGRRDVRYRLTDAGAELEPALVALARFGAGRMGRREAHQLWLPGWTTLALQARFRPERARGIHETYEFHVGDEVFHASVADGALTTASGPAPRAELVLKAGAEDFLRLASGELTAEQALADPAIQVAGDPAVLARCNAIFGLSPA